MTAKKIRISNKVSGWEELFAIVDEKNFEWLNNYRWYALKSFRSKTFYAIARVKGKTSYMHMLIMGKSKGKEVDHKDLNGLNNLRSNLRFCTRSQNIHNAVVRINCKSGLKGVSIASDKRRNKLWRARIRVNQKEKLIGYFYTKEEAGKAYDQEAIEYFGQFARLNYD